VSERRSHFKMYLYIYVYTSVHQGYDTSFRRWWGESTPRTAKRKIPQYQRHEEDNLEAVERREQRLMDPLRQSNEMQRSMISQIEALKAQVSELQSPSSRRPEHKNCPDPFRIPPTVF